MFTEDVKQQHNNNNNMPSGLFYLIHRMGSFTTRGVWYNYFHHFYRNCVKFHANSEDSAQTPRSAVSDLGLYCLPNSMHFLERSFISETQESSVYIYSRQCITRSVLSKVTGLRVL